MRVLVAFALFTQAVAQCPDGGVSQQDRCWYLSETGQSCSATCSGKGLGYSFLVAGEADPLIPKLVGRAPGTRQFAWARTECYVESQDRYHTAKDVANSDAADSGQPGDWSVSVCRLACPCAAAPAKPVAPPPDPATPYPGCAQQGAVLRHAGAHAIFVDSSSFGSTGCWQNDCKHTDKFDAEDMGICGRACAATEECTHWSFGEQDGAKKCFLRKSDAGREGMDGFFAAAKGCGPADVSAGQLAFEASQVLAACDAGKSDQCPDMARAINTWKFAITNLKAAATGSLDTNTEQYLDQVLGDTDAFAAQMSEENFPVIVGNNRQVFNALGGWLAAAPKTPVDKNDASLPNPLRGELCGPSSCYERM